MKNFLLGTLTLVVIACGPEPIDMDTLQTSDDDVWFLDDQLYSGAVYRVGENGYLRSAGSLKNGKMDGRWDFYSPANGSRTSRGTYKDGVEHGPHWTAVDGELQLNGSYKDGDKCGEWVMDPYEVLQDFAANPNAVLQDLQDGGTGADVISAIASILQDGGTGVDVISAITSVMMDMEEVRNYPPC